MSEKFSLISSFKRLLSSAWQNCKSGVAWLDKHKQFLFLLLLLFITIAIFFPTLAKGVSFLWNLSVEESRKTFYLFTIAAGSIGLALGVWRSVVANRQEENTRDQIEISIKGQFSDRFAKAVELTSNNNLSIRLGGLAALKSLAEENFDERKRVFTYLCSFLRYPPDLDDWTSDLEKGEARRNYDSLSVPFGQRPDIDEICKMICERKMKYGTERILIDLRRAYLRGANLLDADLWGAILLGTNLKGAILQHTDLQRAILQEANLQDTYLQRANFSNALFGSFYSDKRQDLSAIKDLKQLENTFYDKESPEPILDENLERKRDRKIHLVPISGEEWMEQHSPRTKL